MLEQQNLSTNLIHYKQMECLSSWITKSVDSEANTETSLFVYSFFRILECNNNMKLICQKHDGLTTMRI
jgi:hypothetical protein